MNSEGDSLHETETQNQQAQGFVLDNAEFIPSSDRTLNSTPRNCRSISYLDVTRLQEAEGFSPSAASWERMRGLSQSICDLKTLREKQLGRRSRSVLFEDNFLQEHAKKLEEARTKIKALERKYCSPQRPLSCSNLSALERNWRAIGSATPGINKTENFEKVGFEESLVVEDIQLPKKCVRRSLNKELSDDRSTDKPNGLDLKKTRTNTKRPVTWADNEDLYSSDFNSISSHDLNWRKHVEMIPDKEYNVQRLRYLGYKGSPERPNSEDNTSDSVISLPHSKIIIQPVKSAKHLISGHKLSAILKTPDKAKWNSMPNLPTSQNECNQNIEMMYEEAIPVEPNNNCKKHRSKFGRRSGLYVVNENPEERDLQPISTSQKLKLRRLFHKKGSPKMQTSKYTSVSSPKEAQSIGRLISFHPTVEAAYVVEIRRPASGALGFLIQKGYHQHRNGIFICRMTDKKIEKFFGGLIHIGDEILEINNTNIQEKSVEFVNKLIKSSDKLHMTILPYLVQKNC